MEDTEYNELLYFVSSKTYPKRVSCIKDPSLKKNEKKKLRSKCKGLRAHDGMLYKGCQRLLRKNEVQGVLRSLHTGQFAGGHLGRDKTYDKIRKHYTWKHLKEDVREYVKNCDKCSRINIAPPKSAPPLNPIQVPAKVWSLVGIDIIGPFQCSTSGNKYIVAATDHFSKWSVAEAIPNKSAEYVSKFMLKMICTYGPMDSIITDQGKEFTNKVIDCITTTLDIDHRISSAYHPQTNGQRERDNRTLKEMLSKYVGAKGDDWDQVLDFVMFAYRTSRHSSTKLTPFNVMFGRDPKLVREDVELDGSAITSDGLKTLMDIRKELNEKACENIEIAQKHQKRNYDNRNKSYVAFKLGSSVLIKNANKIRRFGGKLEPRWLGPYTVVEVLSKGRVRLQNESSKKVLKNVYHSSNCKLYSANKKLTEARPPNKRLNKPPQVSKPLRTLRALPSKLKSMRLKTKNHYLPVRKINKRSQKPSIPLKRKTQKESNAFHPPTKKINKRLCQKLNINFVKQPQYKKMNKKEPYVIKNVGCDSNCFFRAISYAVSGSENSYREVRAATVDHMKSANATRKLKKYLNKNVNRYLTQTNMMKDGTWATDAEIMGVASLLDIDICVYAKHGFKHSWLRYPASFRLGKFSEHALFLENLQNEHFKVVIETL